MKFTLIGPTYPFRGGIAHYTTLLYYALTERHEVQFISFKRQYPRWLFPGKTDRDNSKKPLTAPCQRIIDPLQPWTWGQTIRKIKIYRPDVILFQWWVPFWSPTFTTIAWMSHRLLNTKIVFICHNVLPHDKLRFGEYLLIKTALKQGDCFVVHSGKDEKKLRTIVGGKKIAKIHHPTYEVFSSYYEARQSIDNNSKTVLFFGFVRPYKGLSYLLEALPLVLQSVKIHLLIVGEFWSNRSDYFELIDRLRIENRISIVDQYIPNEQVGQYFNKADVVVLPYTQATQSGIIQIAFGFQKPVITTDVGGLAEVVEHEKTGLIVPAQNSEALAEAIVKFFQNNLSIPFKENIRKKYASFSWRCFVEQLEILVGI